MILFNPSDDEMQAIIKGRIIETTKALGAEIDRLYVSGSANPANNGPLKSRETFKGSGIWTFFDDPVQSAVHCVFEEQERDSTQPE